MALSSSVLKNLIISEMNSRGMNPSNGAYGDAFFEALSVAIVAHITSSGQAVVASGSSTGSWPIV